MLDWNSGTTLASLCHVGSHLNHLSLSCFMENGVKPYRSCPFSQDVVRFHCSQSVKSTVILASPPKPTVPSVPCHAPALLLSSGPLWCGTQSCSYLKQTQSSHGALSPDSSSSGLWSAFSLSSLRQQNNGLTIFRSTTQSSLRTELIILEGKCSPKAFL